MHARKLYIAVLISMTLLAVLGVWTLIEGAAAYLSRPHVEAQTPRQQAPSLAFPLRYDPQ